ncbi:MAG: hypothetical protein IPM37_23055 [Hahellaceae bacterium]|nr:hypothetical protein [Hahellaceae bacterium]
MLAESGNFVEWDGLCANGPDRVWRKVFWRIEARRVNANGDVNRLTA